MPHPMLTRDGSGLTGGPAPVTLPTAPVATLPVSPLPTPPLPNPPSPVLPTPGIETADEFQFDEMFLGNPGSTQEALELLGFPVAGGGGDSITTFHNHGTVFSCSRADGTFVQVRPDIYEAAVEAVGFAAANEMFC